MDIITEGYINALNAYRTDLENLIKELEDRNRYLKDTYPNDFYTIDAQAATTVTEYETNKLIIGRLKQILEHAKEA